MYYDKCHFTWRLLIYFFKIPNQIFVLFNSKNFFFISKSRKFFNILKIDLFLDIYVRFVEKCWLKIFFSCYFQAFTIINYRLSCLNALQVVVEGTGSRQKASWCGGWIWSWLLRLFITTQLHGWILVLSFYYFFFEHFKFLLLEFFCLFYEYP